MSPTSQLLPLNCSVAYYPNFLTIQEANALYRYLIENYQVDTTKLVMEVAGVKKEIDSYKVLFASEQLIEQGELPERVFGKTFLWAGLMTELRAKVEALTHTVFDIAMVIYYPNGGYHAPFHSDQETSGVKTVLPSLSLGIERPFVFRNKINPEDTHTLHLANGSLLVMKDHCQSRYEHSLPLVPKCTTGRINITFREANYR
ncbi:MAG: alpha-ketoglutarate-dependent dioxygenase AlkB [Bacteroidota bacterium]